MTLHTIYADFHVHVGRANGRPVKMAAAPSLTVERIIDHARRQKGLDVVTVIDAVCPPVLNELRMLVSAGRLAEQPGGGLRCDNGLVVLLGAEVEISGPAGGAAHFGCWFGSLLAAEDFGAWLSTVQTNSSLSSQRARVDAAALQEAVHARDGIFIVHHAFTPHKGLYGSCVRRLADMLDPARVDGLELGLSADTDMADCISELWELTFLTNSDAHSLPKIAREYNRLAVQEASFGEVRWALQRADGRRVTGNFGLHPALGKYHRAACFDCGRYWPAGPPVCECGSTRRVEGVYDRWLEVRDRERPIHPDHRPPYIYQVPLEFVPGLGPRLRARLLDAFGTEMQILHQVSVDELAAVVGWPLARRIEAARSGQAVFTAGGGGQYGRVQFDATESVQ